MIRRALAVTLAVACLSLAIPAQAANPTVPLMFGAAAPNLQTVQDHERVLGATLRGLRVYKSWDSPLFGQTELTERDTGHTLFMSINGHRQDGTVTLWRDIAAAKPGSRLWGDMESQARQVAAFKAPVWLTFHHEPNASANQVFGSAADYVGAYRKWSSVMRAAGASNVHFAWVVTAYSLIRGDGQAFYPGDGYVEDIAADGYNWQRCHGTNAWLEASTIFDGQRRFGLQHPTKSLMIWEYNTVEDPAVPGRKAQWYRNVAQTMQLPAWSQYKAVLTWEGRAFGSVPYDCRFDYTTSVSATQGWHDMGNDPSFRAVTVPS